MRYERIWCQVGVVLLLGSFDSGTGGVEAWTSNDYNEASHCCGISGLFLIVETRGASATPWRLSWPSPWRPCSRGLGACTPSPSSALIAHLLCGSATCCAAQIETIRRVLPCIAV